MTDSNWQQRLDELCDAALDLAPGERAAFIANSCGNDQDLQREVEALLAHAANSDNFLTAPIDAVAAHVLEEAPQAPLVGRQVGPYTLLSLLGVGGMGEVYRALDTRLDREVALKLFTDVTPAARRSRGFQREACAVASLRHRHICVIHDVGVHDGSHYLVMEYLQGNTLKQRLQQNPPLSLGDALRVASEVADALVEAHAHGIFHHDVKPANIMLTPDGAKLLDFGLAQRVDEQPASATADSAYQRMGTPAYGSPERLRGDAADGRSDVFSFGVVLYEMLSGHSPFDGTEVTEIVAAVLSKTPSPLSIVSPQIPAPLIEVVNRCLEKEAARRYQSVVEVSRDLWDIRAHVGAAVESFTPRHNLPAELTSFVGRRRELSELSSLLRTARLLTIVGTGGSGKTRLALRVASQGLNAYEDGVRLVELGGLPHDDLVLPHLNSTFDVRAEEGRAPVQTLIDFLRHKRLLLVLDNCEHVVTSTAAAAEALVASCPGVTILATSREPLSVDGERVWRIPPLAYPDSLAASGHDLTDCDAVQLFIERAETVAPLQRDVQTMRCVVEICQRLDGIPLAIEMAAARLDVLSLDQIAQRLADRLLVLRGPVRATSARHKTLRQTIDWSYELLTGAEQALFNRLAAFSGTFSLAAAEAICSDDAELRREDIVEVMSRLVAKSMVMSRRTTVGVRFVLLETLREYALEQLRRSGIEHDTRRRHADFFVGCAEEIAGQVERAQRATADACAEQEHANLLAAIAWCSDRPEHLHWGMRIATALRPFWDSRCYLKLAKQELLRVLRADDTTTPPIVRIKALDAAGYFLFKLDERDAARVIFEQSLRLAEDHGDSWHIANAWYWLSVLASWQERTSDSQAAAECSLAISRTNGFEQITADVLNHLGCLAFDHGELQRASAYCDESLEIFRRLDHEPGITRSLFSCAMLADAKLDCSRAGALYNEAVAAARQTRHKGNEAFALTRLADVYASIGRRNSRDLYNEALAIGRDTGYTRIVALALIQLGGTLCDQGDYAEADRLLDDSRGLLTQLNAQTSLLAARRDLYAARAAYERGQYGQALRLCEPISQFKAFEATISLREIVWRQRGWISLAQGDQEGAKAAFQESSRLAEHSQLPLAVIGSHLGLGYVDLRESRTDSARHHFDLALSECDQHDSKRLLAEALLALGDIHLLEADTKSARRLCVRALDVARDLGSKKNLARALRSLGVIASNEHLPELAAQHLAIGTTLLKALGAEAPWFQSIGYEAAVAAVCADISEDVFQRLWEGSVFRSMDQIESLVRNGQFAQ